MVSSKNILLNNNPCVVDNESIELPFVTSLRRDDKTYSRTIEINCSHFSSSNDLPDDDILL